ncbi:hypothetical protein [Roseobacter sp. MH60115]|uniref:hypothetical protein n=1 Tax=Roseobacter sp. MH60115 TaxID=2785324 RepID=UPI0018A26BC4|nr:hypothetical protein [Roseobacter sp. MH60115]
MAEETIFVQFDKVGFYSPATGAIGTGKNRGDIYRMPASFAETDAKKKRRFLPSSAEIMDEDEANDLVHPTTGSPSSPRRWIDNTCPTRRNHRSGAPNQRPPDQIGWALRGHAPPSRNAARPAMLRWLGASQQTQQPRRRT